MLTEERPAPAVTTGDDPAPAPALRRTRARRRLHRFFVARRGPLVKVHRWASLLLLLWILLESVTGSAIVFDQEIDRMVNASHFASTAGDVGLDRAIDSAKAARPKDFLDSITRPSKATGGMYSAYLVDGEGVYHRVLVDPGKGRVTSADHEPPALLGLAERLHFDLNSSSVFGLTGLRFIGWLSVGWLLILVTGMYLWYWPGVKRWARAVRVRRTRGRFTFQMDLHKAVGFVVAVPLTIVVVTGMNFAFPEQVKHVYDTVTFHAYDAPDVTRAVSGAAGGRTSIGAQRAARIVQSVDPSIVVETVSTPGGSPVGVYEVSARVDASFFDRVGGQRNVEFNVDQYRGTIVSIEDPLTENAATQALDDYSYQVHFGTFGGTTTRWIWVLLGLSPVLLGVTGVIMWITRRSKRRRAPGRRRTGGDPTDRRPTDVRPAPNREATDRTGPREPVFVSASVTAVPLDAAPIAPTDPTEPADTELP